MKRVFTLLCSVAAGAAFAADLGYVYAPGRGGGGGDMDASRELKWDNGSRSYFVWWFTGANSWVGNDFKGLLSSSTEYAVKKVRVHTTSFWPNDKWDGFRVAIYEFTDTPGSIIWPTNQTGYFFKPANLAGHVWVDVPVDWVTPTNAFAAAIEQVYNPPDCDPFAVDTNATFRGHSWRQYNNTGWYPFYSPANPYRNLMIRVVVADNTPDVGVTPSSLGRVKALYY